MCIILTCESGVRPDSKLINDCFATNPDGAGIMWCDGGYVQTAKGFMDEWSLLDAIDAVPNESPLVIHMRIATSGGITTGTCHPFPICDDLNVLHAQLTECSAAIAHNGVIAGMPTDGKRGISDTVSFVSSVVNSLLEESHGKITRRVRKAIKRAAPGNRFAIMTSDGKVYRLGDGWETVTTGIEASNSTWRFPSLYTYTWNGSSWEYDPYDDEPLYGPEYQEVFDTLCGGCACKATCMKWGPTCDDVFDTLMGDESIPEFVKACGSSYRWPDYDNSVIQRYGSEDYYIEQDFAVCC